MISTADTRLIERIRALSREQALEAAGFVADAIARELPPRAEAAKELGKLTDQPFQHLEEIEQLARLLLMEAATTEEHRGHVRAAVEGAGQKQFILSGTEIVGLAVICLGALHVVVSKGKTYERKTKKIREENGKKTVEIEEEVRYGISGSVAAILEKLGLYR